MKKNKVLKFWNGRTHGNNTMYRGGGFNVAAYTKREAMELISLAAGTFVGVTPYELDNYYSPCWGTPMQHITPTNPCIYLENRSSIVLLAEKVNGEYVKHIKNGK